MNTTINNSDRKISFIRNTFCGKTYTIEEDTEFVTFEINRVQKEEEQYIFYFTIIEIYFRSGYSLDGSVRYSNDINENFVFIYKIKGGVNLFLDRKLKTYFNFTEPIYILENVAHPRRY